MGQTLGSRLAAWCWPRVSPLILVKTSAGEPRAQGSASKLALVLAVVWGPRFLARGLPRRASLHMAAGFSLRDPGESESEQDSSHNLLYDPVSEVVTGPARVQCGRDGPGACIPGGGFVLEPGCHSLLSCLWIKEVAREIRAIHLLTYITNISPIFHWSFTYGVLVI